MKTITLEQAQAMGTQGEPLTVNGFDIYSGGRHIADCGANNQETCPARIKSEDKYNAALLAHCFNNFQEVVEALEAMLTFQKGFTQRTAGKLSAIEQANAAINKAKKIQIL